uniref:Uncharacterized protein n=1 Tax=Anguilla anguilla TaxID=7936 RepID=A0A0E9QPW0_ANGAN
MVLCHRSKHGTTCNLTYFCPFDGAFKAAITTVLHVFDDPCHTAHRGLWECYG